MTQQKITDRYKISPAYLERINKLKEFIGPDKFEMILSGMEEIDIPLEQNKFDELMDICLSERPAEPIPYDEAGEIISFFCKPFAGKYLKQATYTLNGISSLLQNLDPKVLKILTESGSFPNPNGIFTDASKLPKGTSKQEKESIN